MKYQNIVVRLQRMFPALKFGVVTFSHDQIVLLSWVRNNEVQAVSWLNRPSTNLMCIASKVLARAYPGTIIRV